MRQPRNFTRMAVLNEGDMAIAIDRFYRPNTTRGCDCRIAHMAEMMQSDGRTIPAEENVSILVNEFIRSNKKKMAILVCKPTPPGQINQVKYWSVVHLTREPRGNIVGIICDPYFNQSQQNTRSKEVTKILKSFGINEIYSKTVSTPRNAYQYGDQALYIAIALSQTTQRNFFSNDIFPINALTPPSATSLHRKQPQAKPGTGIIIDRKTKQPLEFLALNREFLYSHFKEHDRSLNYLNLPVRGITGTRSFQEFDTRSLADKCKDDLLISRNKIHDNFRKKSFLDEKYRKETNRHLKQNIKKEHYQLTLQDKECLKTFANALLPFAISNNRKAVSMIYQIRDSVIVNKNLQSFVDLFDNLVREPSLTNNAKFQDEFYRRLSCLQRGIDPFLTSPNYSNSSSTNQSYNSPTNLTTTTPNSASSKQTSQTSIKSELKEISKRILSHQSSDTSASQRDTKPAINLEKRTQGEYYFKKGNNSNSSISKTNQSLFVERTRTPYSSNNTRSL